VAQVLNMTVREALGFFDAVPAHQEQAADAGRRRLDYIAWTVAPRCRARGPRVKLATAGSRRATGRTLYILDEADVVQRLQLALDGRHGVEEAERSRTVMFKHLGHAGALVMDLERLAVVALGLCRRRSDVDVGRKCISTFTSPSP